MRLNYQFGNKIVLIFRYRRKEHVTNVDDFKKDVLRRSIFGFYDDQFSTGKKLTLKLRDKLLAFWVISVQNFEKHEFTYRKTNDGHENEFNRSN
jgi:hypothetical protein